MLDALVTKLKLPKQDLQVRLAQLLVVGKTDSGSVKVVADANKQIRQILISQDFFDNNDKESIEEATQIAVNRALENAEEIYKEEIQGVE